MKKLILSAVNDNFIPAYATEGSAGLDLKAYIDEPVVINNTSTAVIPVGFHMILPVGFQAEIRPRSGLAAKYGVTVINSPGTIDSDYRGMVAVVLWKATPGEFIIEPEMRIAQMVITKYVAPEIISVTKEQYESLGIDSKRKDGGFGSTGI